MNLSLFAHNISAFLEQECVFHKTEFDFLKIDADGPDYAKLEAILGAG